MGLKVLILNRGEISKRIAVACLECGHTPVGVYGLNDTLPPIFKEKIKLNGNTIEETYLNTNQIIEICKNNKIDALHPGYGFLSENPAFVKLLEDQNIVYIGPTSQSIQKMGLKIESKEYAKSIGVPVLPWFSYKNKDSMSTIFEDAKSVGYPLIIKASAGGGGRGMRIVSDEINLKESIDSCMSEASRNFKDAVVFIEKYIENPRHIEVQVVGDGHGSAIHIGTRECSVQRRYQKIIEEAPACGLPVKVTESMCKDAVLLTKSINYKSLGTLEFIYDGKQYYFLEMNTRIQVEHTVSELISGLDLVHIQLNLLNDLYKLPAQSNINLKGHAIEFRLCAESPDKGFMPSVGDLIKFQLPHWPNIRIDDGLYEGLKIRPEFDSMLAKICSYSDSRNTCITRLINYLNEVRVLGVDTNISCVKEILSGEEFKTFKVYTNWLDKQIFRKTEMDHRKIAKLFLLVQQTQAESKKADLVQDDSDSTSIFNRVTL